MFTPAGAPEKALKALDTVEITVLMDNMTSDIQERFAPCPWMASWADFTFQGSTKR